MAGDTNRNAWAYLALERTARLGADTAVLEAVTNEVSVQLPSWAPLLELPTPKLHAPDFPGYAQYRTTAQDAGPGLRILLAEDNELDRKLSKTILDNPMHSIDVARNLATEFAVERAKAII